jgi:peroxiredoxin
MTTRFLTTVILALFLLPSITGCSDDNAEEVEEMIDDSMGMDGNKAPDFVLNSVSGSEVKLADFEGKPLVIFFFGSTCPLCIASAPSIESKINDGFTDSEIGIIGIDTWNGSQSAVERFRTSTNTSFDLLLNGSGVQSDYMTTYDRLFVIDKDGNIVHTGSTSAGNDVDTVVGVLNNLL